MPALNADILYLMFNTANMNRWNDHMRPVELTELDKQAHKASIAWVLGKFEESAGRSVEWRTVIEHTLFSFIQRSVLTDLKPQVFHRIASERSGPVNEFVLSEYDRLVPGSDAGFRDRLIGYLESEKDSEEDRIIRAAHYLATRWEFNLIYDSNRSLYGIEQTRREIEEQIEQHGDLVGVKEFKTAGNTFNFVDLIGQLRFQQRWARTPRIPRTTVLGHSLLVANMMFLHDLDCGASGRGIYNDFYTGLFHDLPEVLTKDVITPIKTSVDGLSAILEEYEKDLVESKIMPLLREDWRDEFRTMVYSPFSDIDIPGFGERNGSDLKACDHMGAYMEAFISRRYGITSNTLLEGERSIRDKLIEKGDGIGAKRLLEDFDRMRIRCPLLWIFEKTGPGPPRREIAPPIPADRPRHEPGKGTSVVAVDYFLTAHVGPEHLGDGDGAVLVLVVLEDRDHGPRKGEAGSVEGVHELALEVGLAPELDPCPAGLEISKVGAGRCLEVRILSGCVELQIIALVA